MTQKWHILACLVRALYRIDWNLKYLLQTLPVIVLDVLHTEPWSPWQQSYLISALCRLGRICWAKREAYQYHWLCNKNINPLYFLIMSLSLLRDWRQETLNGSLQNPFLCSKIYSCPLPFPSLIIPDPDQAIQPLYFATAPPGRADF